MDSPQQSPDEEQRQASQPLYEFAANSTAVTPSAEEQMVGGDAGADTLSASDAAMVSKDYRTQQSVIAPLKPQQEVEDAHQPSEEEISQGLIYPPPPSFYQNMKFASGQFPLPPVVPAPITASPHDKHPLAPPAARLSPLGPMIGGEWLSSPFVPAPPAVTPYLVKSSRKWIWVLVTLLFSALLLSCGLCSWVLYAVISPTVQDLRRSEELVNNYYEAIRDKNYDVAYQYLAPQGAINGLTKAQFIQQAQGRDKQYGYVLSFMPSQPAFESGTGLNPAHFSITMQVSRPKLKYNVLLSLQKIGDTWKIVDFDKI